jgi:hypothetical protein
MDRPLAAPNRLAFPKQITSNQCVKLLIALFFCGLSAVSISAATRGKKLIDYGWGSPDTAYYRAHLKELEAIPFDGLVISAMKLKGNDPPDNMGWCAFGSEARFTSQDCQHAIDDLKAAKSKRFRDNFIQVVTSGNVDWFDPGWPQIATNVALLARIAKQGGCKGIMLDAEQYDRFRMWTYATLPEKLKAAHSFDEYQAKVRDRGRELIRAINHEYKDLAILMLFGPSLTHRAQGKGMLKDSQYSLLAPFCDGMAEAATPKTTIIDGYEFSYGYRSAEQFADGRKTILNSVNKSLNREALRKHLRVGFGIWADNDSLKRGWHPEDFSKNYFTPAQLRTSLNHALNASDEYVWVYSERLKWWKGTPPKEYVEALDLARETPDPREAR